ncbi:unnamed protein product [Caenorhabditis auriculariae]|uniref:pantothenate kinase n=1 Tax=Caenorhabditis auriculariae TaxID=2777116 RepID=A0A8S1GLW7_9PELO|nr:unnamed protein product [Caenorhabditis auriculariae]
MGHTRKLRSSPSKLGVRRHSAAIFFENAKKRKVMDELLLNSSLRRVDSASGIVHPPRQHANPPGETPFIVLPVESRFSPMFERSRFALDIGGTLLKLVYSSVCQPGSKPQHVLNNGNKQKKLSEDPEVHVNFLKFGSIETCIEFIKKNWKDRVETDVLHCTGGGSYKHAELLQKALGVKVRRTDEMNSLIYGCDFLLRNNEDESFTYHHEAKGLEKFQYRPINADSIYPFLLVNIGTGISILKVDSPTEFQRVGGSSMGGGTFIGLGNLLTSATDFDALLKMADRGDHRKVDTLVSDIYGGSYGNLNLPGDLIAGSFGKCNKYDNRPSSTPPSPEDIAKSLLLMLSNNIGQMAMLYGHRYGMKRVYFGGFFIRKHPITMRTLSYAINFWSKGETEALFMKHEGYLGAMGAFLDENGDHA